MKKHKNFIDNPHLEECNEFEYAKSCLGFNNILQNNYISKIFKNLQNGIIGVYKLLNNKLEQLEAQGKIRKINYFLEPKNCLSP